MTELRTLGELHVHNDWANEKLLAIAATLDDARLDRKFEMGIGSIRDTLHHVWAAEKVWLERWQEKKDAKFIFPEAGVSVAELARRYHEIAEQRNAFLSKAGLEDTRRKITYTNTKGETFTYPLGDLALHVANHGIHHRAQLVNMFRHVGAEVPKPGVDYIFMRRGGDGPPMARLEVDTIGEYFRYGDWANDRVLIAASKLTDAQLDREFEMGMGTLRKTLAHVHDAERWWQGNWRGDNKVAFPPASIATIADLQRTWAETANARKQVLGSANDDELTRPVTVEPFPGRMFTYPLGVSMLQLCCHGTHHRAQTINMLRHLGGETPGLDYVLYLREFTA